MTQGYPASGVAHQFHSMSGDYNHPLRKITTKNCANNFMGSNHI